MDDTARDIAPVATVRTEKRSMLFDVARRLVREKPLGTIGGIIVLVLLIGSIFADLLAPYGMNEPHPADTFSPPSAKYILGTDNLGRDVLTRIIHGARVSLIVGLSATTISVLISTCIGISSGFIGGRYDLIIQRFVDAFMCLPGLFIILTMMAILTPGMWQVIIVIGILYGVGGSRVVRGNVIGVKENVYIQAAAAIGSPVWRTLSRHIVPNIMPTLIILFTIGIGSAILLESTVSFLGYGIPPPTPSWGGMLSGAGRRYMSTAPWLALWPGLAIAIVVYGINMLGDALRDILDPRLRGGMGGYEVKRARKAMRKKQSGKEGQ
jgi:peptide/nickel transport system permease protein